MHLPTALLPTLLLLLDPVTSRPAPSPQDPYSGLGLQCTNGPACDRMWVMSCSGGDLICSLGNMVNVPVGKCSECAGSVCAKSPDDYPGDSTPKPTNARAADSDVVDKSDTELEPRQTFGGWCQAGWSCSCVSFDGKGYYTRGKGSLCNASQGGLESCTEENGFTCDFGCRSPLLNGFTNAKCHALFPGTRAVCRSY